MQVLDEMRELGQFCDCTLKSQDGASFEVHRCIMATASPYFLALFTYNTEATLAREFTVFGISGPMLELIIRYAYTRQTQVTAENAEELITAADQLNVMGMVEDCNKFLLTLIDVGNCIGLNKFAISFVYNTLRQKTRRFILKEFRSIAEKSKELLDLSSEELQDILTDDELNITEPEVWQVILKWINKDPENRKEKIADLLKCVRVGLMSIQYFLPYIREHPYVCSNAACKPVVIEMMSYLCNLKMRTSNKPSFARHRLPHEILFVIGGWSSGSPTGIIEVYNVKTNKWHLVQNPDPSGPRAYHKCAVVDYHIYVIGGFDGIDYFNSCRRFNLLTKKWEEIAPMHTKRCYVSVCSLDNKVYALGGYDGHHRQNTAERYDKEANQWSNINPMNIQRSDACAASLKGRVYITGGFNGVECLDSVEYYDPKFNQWNNVSPMNCKRSGISCVAFDGFIYTVGGFDGTMRLCTGEKYDPTEDSWTSIAAMQCPRSNYCLQAMNQRIFALGGFNGMTTIQDCEYYDPSANEWHEMKSMNCVRSALAGCVVDDLPNIRDYIRESEAGPSVPPDIHNDQMIDMLENWGEINMGLDFEE